MHNRIKRDEVGGSWGGGMLVVEQGRRGARAARATALVVLSVLATSALAAPQPRPPPPGLLDPPPPGDVAALTLPPGRLLLTSAASTGVFFLSLDDLGRGSGKVELTIYFVDAKPLVHHGIAALQGV